MRKLNSNTEAFIYVAGYVLVLFGGFKLFTWDDPQVLILFYLVNYVKNMWLILFIGVLLYALFLLLLIKLADKIGILLVSLLIPKIHKTDNSNHKL